MTTNPSSENIQKFCAQCDEQEAQNKGDNLENSKISHEVKVVPRDIILDIFQKLPLKSLVRLLLVNGFIRKDLLSDLLREELSSIVYLRTEDPCLVTLMNLHLFESDVFAWNVILRVVEKLPYHGVEQIDAYGFACDSDNTPILILAGGKTVLHMNFRRGILWQEIETNFDIGGMQFNDFGDFRGRFYKGSFYWFSDTKLVAFNTRTLSYTERVLECEIHRIDIVADKLVAVKFENNQFNLYRVSEQALEPFLQTRHSPCNDLRVIGWKNYTIVIRGNIIPFFIVGYVEFYSDSECLLKVEEVPQGFEECLVISKSLCPSLLRFCKE